MTDENEVSDFFKYPPKGLIMFCTTLSLLIDSTIASTEFLNFKLLFAVKRKIDF